MVHVMCSTVTSTRETMPREGRWGHSPLVILRDDFYAGGLGYSFSRQTPDRGRTCCQSVPCGGFVTENRGAQRAGFEGVSVMLGVKGYWKNWSFAGSVIQ